MTTKLHICPFSVKWLKFPQQCWTAHWMTHFFRYMETLVEIYNFSSSPLYFPHHKAHIKALNFHKNQPCAGFQNLSRIPPFWIYRGERRAFIGHEAPSASLTALPSRRSPPRCLLPLLFALIHWKLIATGHFRRSLCVRCESRVQGSMIYMF